MNGLDYIKTTKANRDKEIAEKEKGINDQNAQARNALKAHNCLSLTMMIHTAGVLLA